MSNHARAYTKSWEAVPLRRLVVLLLLLTLFASGCFSLARQNAPTVESQFGLVTVQPASSVPDELPVLSAEVSLAPVLDTYEDCHDFLQQVNALGQLNKLCVAHWSRDDESGPGLDHVSFTVMIGSDPTRFRVFLLAYRPDEMHEPIAVSKEYLAPPNWAGNLTFDVPLTTYKRVLSAQVEITSGGQFPEVLFFPPCPEDYPWPESYTYEDCVAEFH